MTFTVLCSGQGGQHSAMFDLFAEEAGVSLLIARADECARFDLVAAVASDAMFGNEIAQPLICAYQGITWSLLASRLAAAAVVPSIVAGYSVGELASHGCAGSLSWADVIALARDRATSMSAAGGDGNGLLAIRGLARGEIDTLLATHGLFIAIVNGNDQFIVGGAGLSLIAMAADVAGRGGSTQRLPVGIAAHTPLLRDAVAPFRKELERRTWKDPQIPVLAGLDGSAVRDAQTAIDVLARQIANPIQWSTCMDAIRERGTTVCLELGPGNALARLLHERHPDIAVRSVADFRSIDAVVEWVVDESR